jgi:hypothetical protein
VRAEVTVPLTSNVCADCADIVGILHNRPGETGRKICGACQGKANRKIIDRIAECVRTLKTSTSPDDERAAILDLISLCGRDDADATIKAVTAGRAAGKYTVQHHQGGSRR